MGLRPLSGAVTSRQAAQCHRGARIFGAANRDGPVGRRVRHRSFQVCNKDGCGEAWSRSWDHGFLRPLGGWPWSGVAVFWMDPRNSQVERLRPFSASHGSLYSRRSPRMPSAGGATHLQSPCGDRLTRKPRPSEESLHSQRRVRPHQIFQVCESVSRTLSVWLTDQGCGLARLLPVPRNRFVARVELLRGAGCRSQAVLNETHVPLVTSMVEGLAQGCPRPGGGRAAVGQRNWIRRSSRTRTRSVRRLKKISRLQ